MQASKARLVRACSDHSEASKAYSLCSVLERRNAALKSQPFLTLTLPRYKFLVPSLRYSAAKMAQVQQAHPLLVTHTKFHRNLTCDPSGTQRRSHKHTASLCTCFLSFHRCHQTHHIPALGSHRKQRRSNSKRASCSFYIPTHPLKTQPFPTYILTTFSSDLVFS